MPNANAAQSGRKASGRTRATGKSPRAAQTPPPAVLQASEYLLRLSRAGLTAALDDLTVIDDELRQLRAARQVLVDWVRDLQAEGWESGPPVPFMRAWSESTRQVLQLLRARRELVGSSDAWLEADALDALEELPGLRQLLDRGSASDVEAGATASSHTGGSAKPGPEAEV